MSWIRTLHKWFVWWQINNGMRRMEWDVYGFYPTYKIRHTVHLTGYKDKGSRHRCRVINLSTKERLSCVLSYLNDGLYLRSLCSFGTPVTGSGTSFKIRNPLIFLKSFFPVSPHSSIRLKSSNKLMKP